MELDEITGIIVDTSLRIHRELGPGLLEAVYEAVLANALARRGLTVRRQYPIVFCYDGLTFEEGFRADLLVHEQVIVELKSVERLARVHLKQLLTYLRLADLRVGLLVNFGAPTLKEGLHRVVNRHPDSQSPRLRGSAAPREPHPPATGSSGRLGIERLGPAGAAPGDRLIDELRERVGRLCEGRRLMMPQAGGHTTDADALISSPASAVEARK